MFAHTLSRSVSKHNNLASNVVSETLLVSNHLFLRSNHFILLMFESGCSCVANFYHKHTALVIFIVPFVGLCISICVLFNQACENIVHLTI